MWTMRKGYSVYIVQKMGQFCVGTVKYLFQMCAKRAEISNFAQIFVSRPEISNLSSYFSKRGVIQCRLQKGGHWVTVHKI